MCRKASPSRRQGPDGVNGDEVPPAAPTVRCGLLLPPLGFGLWCDSSGRALAVADSAGPSGRRSARACGTSMSSRNGTVGTPQIAPFKFRRLSRRQLRGGRQHALVGRGHCKDRLRRAAHRPTGGGRRPWQPSLEPATRRRATPRQPRDGRYRPRPTAVLGLPKHGASSQGRSVRRSLPTVLEGRRARGSTPGSASLPLRRSMHPATTASWPRWAHSASMLSRGVCPHRDATATYPILP